MSQTFRLVSDDLTHNEPIPVRFSYYGEDVSPHLRWENAPDGTVSVVLLVNDPDAPHPTAPVRDNTHWLVYNLPAEGEIATGGELPSGAVTGLIYDGSARYAGAAPPADGGRHRYYHRVFAIDTTVDGEGLTRAQVEEAIAGHVLAEATLLGTFDAAADAGQ